MKAASGFLPVVRRELGLMAKYPIYLIMIVVIPLVCYLFFASLMPEGLPERLPVGVIDGDNSVLSRNMIRQLDATAQNRVAAHYTDFSAARNDLQQGKIFGFVVIPSDFEQQLMTNSQPEIRFYYTQAYYIPGSLTLKNFSYMLSTLAGGVALQTLLLHGETEAQAMSIIQPIVPDFHALGNPYVNYSVYLIDILIPGVLELIILLTTVYAIGTELKQRSSRRWLRTGDYSILKALAGKLLPYTAAFFVMGMLYNIILFRFMHYPLHADIGWLMLNTLLLIFGAQCMGVFMVGLLPVLRDALSFSSLYGVLAFSFSGFSFPVEGMPAYVQGLSAIFPLRYYFKIYQNFALNGLPARYSLVYFGCMLAFVLFALAVSVRLKKAALYQDYPKK
ncbi:MAG: ABC transporter permease [Prevotellaceae bacterium]|jgi:ABC-2 type transport system permease protein|nr:ABC transporter permease [Prevotellaceae bacterium]